MPWLGAGDVESELDGTPTAPADTKPDDSKTVHVNNATVTVADFEKTDPAHACILASLGDTVWNDLNADGIQDGGETGIVNIAVELLGTETRLSCTHESTLSDRLRAREPASRTHTRAPRRRVFVDGGPVSFLAPRGFAATRVLTRPRRLPSDPA